MKKNKVINKYYYNYKKTDYNPIIELRYKILMWVIIALMLILIVGLYYVQVLKNDYYNVKLAEANQNIVLGDTAPRGRIYDRNGNVIVDNIAVKTIYYKKKNNITLSEEIKMSYKVASMIEVDYSDLNNYDLKSFWLRNNPDLANKKITDEEWILLEERKLTNAEIWQYKIDRVTSDDLSSYNELDLEAAYIYYLMNNGYSYAEKIIKNENVTEEEYASIAENISKLPGFNTKLDWQRYYPYGNVFKSILGSVSTSKSGLPFELKDYYLAIGYSLSDRVGTSYLEYQYESILRGTKTVYEILDSGEYKVISEGERGNDIVLTIDINLQKDVEEILEEELIKTKGEAYTEYFDSSFVVINDPNTGEILAMAGKQIVVDESGEYKIHDYTPGVINASITPGSSVKGASQIVGYVTGALTIGEVRNDACIKIAATPLKCSFSTHGNINDLQALKYSSNTYQFQTAIKVGGGVYKYNKPLSINAEAFETYRSIFSEFGLGVKTGIDLPNEALGYKGTGTLSGLLLDFSIGQYDNYTPIQLSQYISTIANGGYRLKPYLLKSVYAPTKEKLSSLIYENNTTILNKINVDDIYLNRVKEGFKMVFSSGGTGYGTINRIYNPAGKTGTSQSFIDTDYNGIVDTETITSTLVAYAPYDNPKVAFTVVSPNISLGEVPYGRMSKVNTRISQKISQKYFEIYQ